MGEMEEEREGDMLRGLSLPQPKMLVTPLSNIHFHHVKVLMNFVKFGHIG